MNLTFTYLAGPVEKKLKTFTPVGASRDLFESLFCRQSDGRRRDQSVVPNDQVSFVSI